MYNPLLRLQREHVLLKNSSWNFYRFNITLSDVVFVQYNQNMRLYFGITEWFKIIWCNTNIYFLPIMSSIYQRATATWERSSSYNRKITEAFLGSCRSSLGGHLCSIYAKISKKLTFRTPWYVHVTVRIRGITNGFGKILRKHWMNNPDNSSIINVWQEPKYISEISVKTFFLKVKPNPCKVLVE